jgi:DNA-directed RNA polymerase specialized sigma24 family protein
MSDDQLLRRLRAGDPAAYEELFVRSRSRLRDFFAARLPNPADGDDCVSEVLTRALEGIRHGHGPESLDKWVMGIARNVLKERYVEAHHRAAAEILSDVAYSPGDPYLELEQSKIGIEDLITLPSDVEILQNRRDLWALLRPAIEGIGRVLQPVMREHVRLSLERDTLVTGAELAAALDMPLTGLNRQLQRARKATWKAIVALVLARTGRADCAGLAELLDDILAPGQQLAGPDLILTPEQSPVILRHAEHCSRCGSRAADVRDYQGTSFPSSTASGVPHRVPASTGLPITIYLSDESNHEQVQAAVEDLVTAAGGWIELAEDPVFGSWFRRMWARVRVGVRSPAGRELAKVAAHAAESRLVLAQDANVTATMLQHLGPVLTALQPTEDAVVRVGALLIVKVAGVVGVHQLTAAQQLRLDHQPQLATAPREILAALELRTDDTTTTDDGTAVPES